MYSKKLSRFVFSSLVCACLLAAIPVSVFAQLSTASINGTVRDPSGASIADATLALRHVETGVERSSSTNDAGNYGFLSISPGIYTLEVGREGFATSNMQPFSLVVNQTATFDFTLSLGAVTESITVEAVGAEVQSSTAELGAVVEQKQVTDLPLNGRNFTQLLSLTPGAAPVSVAQNAGGFGAASIGEFVYPSINGQTNRSNFWMIDGVMNQALMTSVPAVNPVIDAIQEFKVQSHNDQAEFGGVMGGIVNVVTKSGTNEFHGSTWYYARNDAFDARNFFQREVTPFKQHQFGGAGGGPVVKNRTFFHASFQGYRFRRPANRFYRVPTSANLSGDLSDEGRDIFDPFSTREDPGMPGAFIRDPFPNNQIPGDRLNPGMLLFARTTLPSPVATGLADRNALDSTPFNQNQEEYSGRVDHTFGPKDSVWFRYSTTRLETTQSGGRETLESKLRYPAVNYGVSWVHTFGPTSVLQVQFGRNRYEWLSTRSFLDVPDSFAQEVGYAPDYCCSFIGGTDTLIPGLNVEDFFSGGEANNPHGPTGSWQYKGNYSKIWGNHTFKMGAELNTLGYVSGINDASSTYTSFQTSDPQNPRTGSQLASFLLDVPDAYAIRNVLTTFRFGAVMGWYFQDQWKATPKLTINLGLRYDRTIVPKQGKEEDGNLEVGNYDLGRGVYLLQTMSPSCEDRGRPPCIPGGVLPPNVEIDPRGHLTNDFTDNWQPRVGLAYRLGQKTALRASFGIYFDSYSAVVQMAENFTGSWPSVGVQRKLAINNPVPGTPLPSISGRQPITSLVFPAATPFNQVSWFLDPNLKNPYSMQWNFGVQHQLNTSTVVHANYVGSGTRRLDLGGLYNVAQTPGPGNPQDRAPFPYIRPTYYDRSWSRSNYHSAQFMLEKRYSGGLAYRASYTYSKAIDIGCSGWFVEGCAIQDPYNFNLDRSVAGFDVTQVLSLNWTYQLPFGPGRKYSTGNKVADHIIGNWQLNSITTARSGQPYTLVISGDIANTGNARNYERVNVVGNPELSNPTPERWFNAGAFDAPAPFTFGSVGRNTLRSDGVVNFDFSIFRQFPLGDEKSLEIRVEAFNAFNSPVFGTPGRNFASPATFGRVLSTANDPRILQLGAKIIF